MCVCMRFLYECVCECAYVSMCVCVCVSMYVYENMCVSVEGRGTVHFMFLLGKSFGGLELAKQGRPPG